MENTFDIIERKLDNDIMKIETEFLEYVDMSYIDIIESSRDGFDVYIEFTLEECKAKVIEVFQKILKVLQEFFKNVRIQFHAQVQKIQLNLKLKELKDLMAKKRAKAIGRQFSYFDIRKYKRMYSDFINRYTAELIKGLNKDFKSADEYEAWRTSMYNKLSDFNYKLTDEEQWKLNVEVNNAVKLSIEETENREKNLKMIEEDGSQSIKTLESYYKKFDPYASSIVLNQKEWLINMKNATITSVASRFAKMSKTVTHFILKNIVVCVIGLIAILVIL